MQFRVVSRLCPSNHALDGVQILLALWANFGREMMQRNVTYSTLFLTLSAVLCTS